MHDIKVERYRNPDEIGYSGCIQDEDRSWIIFLNEEGTPTLYWPSRDKNGGVIGTPVSLG